MVRDLDLGIEIVEMPVIREPDGLAMSSRNKYLNPEERQRALALSRGLALAREWLQSGERDPQVIIETVRGAMSAVDIDYIELVDAEEITPLDRVRGAILLAVAARVGATRLIDNIKFTVPDLEE